MDNCSHMRLRCTNNVYFCQDCGQRVALPAPGVADDKQEGQKENAPEGPKKAAKRKAKKEDKQHDTDTDL